MTTEVPGTRVVSEAIKVIGNIGADLYVEYKSGDAYMFPAVDGSILDEVIRMARNKTGSIGKFINTHVKGATLATKVDDLVWDFNSYPPTLPPLRKITCAVTAPDPAWSF